MRNQTVMALVFAIAGVSSTLFTTSCASDDEHGQDDESVRGAAGSGSGDEDGTPELKIGALQEGYTRYETKPIKVDANSTDDWAQWVGGPLDQDYDVVDIGGAQSAGGHHAIMYATTEAQEPGFTRLWSDVDALSARFMGGVGGEGGAKVALPPGVVFRVKKGSYLIVQTHYLNVNDTPIMARSVLDVKLAPADPSHLVASLFSNTDLSYSLAPNDMTSLDVNCETKKELKFLKITNHMHEYGVSALTEYTDAKGDTHMLKDDPSWNYDWAVNPNYDVFSVEKPLVLPAGSKVHTRCEWFNTTDRPIAFPGEMCVFVGFIISPSDMICTGGKWSETAPTP